VRKNHLKLAGRVEISTLPAQMAMGNNWLNLLARDNSSLHANFTGVICAADEQYEQNHTR
jgi:hypothetical protein